MNRLRVLVVDDEPEIVESVVAFLSSDGMNALGVSSPRLALSQIPEFKPDVVLLDRRFPGIPGSEKDRDLLLRSGKTPVIVVTAEITEEAKLEAFAGGADDYVCKPFSFPELALRVRAVTRRTSRQREADHPVREKIQINPLSHEVKINGESVTLTLAEFKLLTALLNRPGEVCSRAFLRDHISANSHVTDRTVDVHMSSVRRKLGSEANWIRTVRGIGYRIKC